jgi:hypothetical protein
VVDLLKAKESRLRLDDQHRSLWKCLAAMHAPEFTAEERKFYRQHLVLGLASGESLPAALTLRLPKVSAFIPTGDRLFQEAMLGEQAAP